jgi:hypothetical protein
MPTPKKVYALIYENEWYMGKSTFELRGVFSTKKAAEEWMEKDPLGPYHFLQEFVLNTVLDKGGTIDA